MHIEVGVVTVEAVAVIFAPVVVISSIFSLQRQRLCQETQPCKPLYPEFTPPLPPLTLVLPLLMNTLR